MQYCLRYATALFLVCLFGSATLLGANAAAIDREPAARDIESKPTKETAASKKAKPAKRPAAKNKDEDSADDDGPPETPPKMEYEAVKLSDGIEVQVEKWGEAYQGYDFRPPLNANDWDTRRKLRKIDRGVDAAVDYVGSTSLVPGHVLRTLRLDAKRQMLYWIDTTTSWKSAHIYRASVNGKNVKVLASGLIDPRGLALDLTNGKIYWAEINYGGSPKIRRASLDGSSMEDVIMGFRGPGGIAIDPDGGHIYFSDDANVHPARIFRANLDGSGQSIFTEGIFGWSMVLEPAKKQLFQRRMMMTASTARRWTARIRRRCSQFHQM